MGTVTYFVIRLHNIRK